VPIGRALRLEAFLASPPGQGAKRVVRNEPWRTLHVASCRIGGEDFGAMLVFEGERLATLVLCLTGPAGKRSFAEIDAAHRLWLAAHLDGAPPWCAEESERRFVWGSLWVGLDVKSGGPEIVLSYAPQRN
jgi:hypothetical protein